MRTPLRRISDSHAVRLVAREAYFTRLYNDLTIRKKCRTCQEYYWEIIMRAAVGLLDSSSQHREILQEATQRVVAFEKAHTKGRLLYGNTQPVTFLQGGATTGSGR